MPRELRPARAIVFAPLGRDALVAQALLREAGISATICRSLSVFQELLSDAVSFAVVTEEAVASADLRGIAGWVAGQPSWSDLPFIVLTQRGGGPERNPAASLPASRENASTDVPHAGPTTVTSASPKSLPRMAEL